MMRHGMTGYLVDPEHADQADNILSYQHNRSAIALLKRWQRSPGGFLVLAGVLHRSDGGIAGGVTGNWTTALGLFAIVSNHFNQVADYVGEDFTTAWMMLVTDERLQDINRIAFEAMPVMGSA